MEKFTSIEKAMMNKLEEVIDNFYLYIGILAECGVYFDIEEKVIAADKPDGLKLLDDTLYTIGTETLLDMFNGNFEEDIEDFMDDKGFYFLYARVFEYLEDKKYF